MTSFSTSCDACSACAGHLHSVFKQRWQTSHRLDIRLSADMIAVETTCVSEGVSARRERQCVCVCVCVCERARE
jgi:hypothetical protein